jgi:hypothetical protein
MPPADAFGRAVSDVTLSTADRCRDRSVDPHTGRIGTDRLLSIQANDGGGTAEGECLRSSGLFRA